MRSLTQSLKALTIVALVVAFPLLPLGQSSALATTCGPSGTLKSEHCPSPVVQTDPTLYIIWWGPGWNSFPLDVPGQHSVLYSNLQGSSYNQILQQYGVNDDVSFGGQWRDSVAPTSTVCDRSCSQGVDSIVGEISRAVQYNPVWQVSTDSQFIVYPQPGTHDDSLGSNCAYHTSVGSDVFSVVPYYSDTPSFCPTYFGTNHQQAMTTIASHEYAEAATDPTNQGYSDPQEIGDLCQHWTPTNRGQFGLVYAQYLWDDTDGNTCQPPGAPGQAPPGPAVAAWSATGQQDVVWRGTDGNMWEASWNNGWSGPANRGFGPMGSEPAVVVSPYFNKEYFFWEGMDSGLWWATWSSANGWTGPEEVSGMGPLGSQPTVGAWSGYPEVDVFWTSTGARNLMEATWNGEVWTGPTPVSGMGPLGSAPSVVVNNNRQEDDVFWKSTGDELIQAYFQASTASWTGPLNHHMGPLNSQTAASAWDSSGEQDVFWQGNGKNDMWWAQWNQGWGQSPYDDSGSGPLGSAPTAVINDLLVQRDTFWEGMDSNLWDAYWSSANGWKLEKVGMGPLG